MLAIGDMINYPHGLLLLLVFCFLSSFSRGLLLLLASICPLATSSCDEADSIINERFLVPCLFIWLHGFVKGGFLLGMVECLCGYFLIFGFGCSRNGIFGNEYL